jgi:hypothetical protein
VILCELSLAPYPKNITSTAIGEVWANKLHNVYAALVQPRVLHEAGSNPDGVEGNIVFLHLFIDALPVRDTESPLTYLLGTPGSKSMSTVLQVLSSTSILWPS